MTAVPPQVAGGDMGSKIEADETGRGAGGARSAVTAVGLVLAAAAAGIAVGLLIAPDSGEKTRARLRRSVRSGWDDLSDNVGRGVKTLRHEGNGVLRRIEDRLGDIEERLESARDAAVDAVEEPIARLRGERRGNPLLGLLAGAAISWFLTSERTADVRAEVRDAARKAKRRATDEWDRFQERGGFSGRSGSPANGATESAEPV
jgi:gas vesicle protein